MRVPIAGGVHGRLIRAHELMHARVSPVAPVIVEAWPDLSPRAVECAEEFRVNELLRRIGFDVDELRDGSERLAGERLAATGEWAELACFAAALSGTRALSDLVRGVRRVAGEWAAACRAIERELGGVVRRVPTSSIASTALGPAGLPLGFATHTRRLAEVVDLWAAAPRAGVRRTARPRATGTFAPLLLDEAVELDRRVHGACVVRRARAAYGRRVLRPDRLVTDPARRVFERRASCRGGVVVVDQSGSMAITEHELVSLLAAAPGAFVVGYSHAPGSQAVPNAWVLADRGRAASRVRAGNVGNGVDGPVLRFALGRRRGREPVVWVSDGQVTDSTDHADPGLAVECAQLALRHGIQMVTGVPEAVGRLAARAAPMERPRLLGRVAAAVTASP